MKQLITSVEVTSIGWAHNGTITCEVTVYYKTHGARKTATHVFNISNLIKEWEK